MPPKVEIENMEIINGVSSFRLTLMEQIKFLSVCLITHTVVVCSNEVKHMMRSTWFRLNLAEKVVQVFLLSLLYAVWDFVFSC